MIRSNFKYTWLLNLGVPYIDILNSFDLISASCLFIVHSMPTRPCESSRHMDVMVV